MNIQSIGVILLVVVDKLKFYMIVKNLFDINLNLLSFFYITYKKGPLNLRKNDFILMYELCLCLQFYVRYVLLRICLLYNICSNISMFAAYISSKYILLGREKLIS
jgi:hypothetical protein